MTAGDDGDLSVASKRGGCDACGCGTCRSAYSAEVNCSPGKLQARPVQSPSVSRLLRPAGEHCFDRTLLGNPRTSASRLCCPRQSRPVITILAFHPSRRGPTPQPEHQHGRRRDDRRPSSGRHQVQKDRRFCRRCQRWEEKVRSQEVERGGPVGMGHYS